MNWRKALENIEAEYPTDDDLNEDAEFNRMVALQNVDRFQKNADLLTQLGVDQVKWVITSLQAINAGGALAITQTEISASFAIGSGAAFVVGLLSPLLSAHLSNWSLVQASMENGQQIGYWQAVATNGFRVRETEVELLKHPILASKRGRASKLLGWLSVVMFLVGATALAFGIAS